VAFWVYDRVIEYIAVRYTVITHFMMGCNAAAAGAAMPNLEQFEVALNRVV
jgi:hypothetical protein